MCRAGGRADGQYNVTVRNALKVHDQERNKWFLMVAKTAQLKQRWLKAFSDERRRVHDDMENSESPLVAGWGDRVQTPAPIRSFSPPSKKCADSLLVCPSPVCICTHTK